MIDIKIFIIIFIIITIIIILVSFSKNEGLVNENGEIVVRNLSGNIINSKTYDISNDGATNLTNDFRVGSNLTDIIKVNYTPISNNSKLLINASMGYINGGYGADTFQSQIIVNQSGKDVMIALREENYMDNSGGGGRGPALFPIAGVYINKSFDPILIRICAKRISGDDDIVFNNYHSGTRLIHVIEEMP